MIFFDLFDQKKQRSDDLVITLIADSQLSCSYVDIEKKGHASLQYLFARIPIFETSVMNFPEMLRSESVATDAARNDIFNFWFSFGGLY